MEPISDQVPGEHEAPARDRQRARTCRTRRVALGITASIAAVLAATGWALGGGNSADHAESGDRLRVVTTTNFLTDAVGVIGGSDIELTGLMGSGVDPHLYQAQAGDLTLLREADLVVAVGLHLEAGLRPVLDDLAEDTRVVFVGETVPTAALLPAESGGAQEYDPHLWFDVALWSDALESVADTLTEVDPGHAVRHRSRWDRHRAELAALHEEVGARLAEIPESRRILITSHDAFRYLGRAYDLRVEAIQGISTADEATVSDIDRVAGIIAEHGVRAVFVESSVSEQTSAAVLDAAAALGATATIGGSLYADAAGAAGTPEGTYPGMIRTDVDLLVAGLR
ncbi:metal ABC transporter solute-binding protein, Zn/Mn family [Actinoalloteichus hymeniacidonis]|uniref:ABC-type metal ion transport system, periplasmic component/surface adhesin n=1 Tax=Actinoalloteichus hymeniacidonis TaxID=340345 RepID=A0AAC9HPC4_9PSEU|nr:zinc ABC transporter substrate-binding protein [Actinoalloteichus hymeniacidonis]AOS62943.1 ABC-type metal ion transport system, periplasmic component/surface adhesin [Actinoalloteichus hymeniacidonis]MBB5909022.1 manganese/zinc/iron transport system substrate-binding protein [Actinoalloteichus hymeniacidonis]